MRILLTANTAFALSNFRLGLIRALVRDGHDVVALVPDGPETALLRAEGCAVHSLSMNRRGRNILEEARTLFGFYRTFRDVTPDVVFGYTIKNNLYGGVVARMRGIPFIPNVTGLGTAFSEDGILKRALMRTYRAAFKTCPTVFFQNRYDMNLLVEHGQVAERQAALLPGSGVDLQRFKAKPLPGTPDAPTFLYVGRLLWEKGVGEFVEAAQRVRKATPNAAFKLLGDLEHGGKDAIRKSQVDRWQAEGHIEYLGRVEDVRDTLAQADCVVLPSYYREGTPRSLLEAAAMARPIITTRTPGCEDVVRDGETGYLVAPRSVDDLVARMTDYIRMSPEHRSAMGHAGRTFMEQSYDERLVIEAYLKTLDGIAN
ncbi:MAG: glycosyltransferase family 4 protein [Pseudomonadota bacterium]